MMKLLYFVFIALCLAFVGIKLPKIDYAYPEIAYSVNELVTSQGYPFEIHTVVTKDGYILELHRIPHGRNKDKNISRPPILIMHGLLCSSIDFFTSGPKSLPYYLTDRGYDVWLGNARGNFYSRKHVSINPDTNTKEFMDFSWHEIGIFDLPALIDYVLAETRHKKLFYAGHSQGCVSFYVMMSERPEYNDKVDVMIALAPVVYTKEIKSLAFTVPAKLQGFLEWLSEAIGYYEFFVRNNAWTQFGNVFCRDGAWTQHMCYLLYDLTGGFNDQGINKTLLPLAYAHFPGGSSVKQLFHYTQIHNSDIFRQYDHGEQKNLGKYGQNTPPLYNLRNTRTPVAIFYADNDWLTSQRDIDVLHKSLPNVIYRYEVPDKLFNHFNFLLSPIAFDILYPNVLSVLEKHRRSKTKA